MEGNFELMESGWYTPINVIANDFLNNKLESEQYGLYYSVRFEGSADTYLWQAKSKPEEGVKVWGHIEESKSGKSMRFKKDKEAESSSNLGSTNNDKAYLKDLSDYPVRIFNGGLNYAKDLGLNLLEASDRRVYLEFVQAVCEELLNMSDNIRNNVKTPVKVATRPVEGRAEALVPARKEEINDPFPSDEDYNEG